MSLAMASCPLTAEESGIRGYWLEPSGAIIRIAPCAQRLCVWIVALPSGDHPRTDVHNPDPTLRERSLCGLRVGREFVESDPQHADSGSLYDPKSGRTYSGALRAEANQLHLRGYVGLKIFGRTETWTRTQAATSLCVAK
ncbi:MAG TPA: DUF2147 domain-containing protein [Steroidobacteraceae bacterium]|nr:DUF2147 domain-containing protein [Steroidobacteraceae bacterium]